MFPQYFDSYSAGLVSLIRRSRDILSDAIMLKPYRAIVGRACSSSSGDNMTGTPIQQTIYFLSA